MATQVKEAPKPTAESIVPNLDFGQLEAKGKPLYQCTRCGGTVFTFGASGKLEKVAGGELRGVTLRRTATCEGCRFTVAIEDVA